MYVCMYVITYIKVNQSIHALVAIGTNIHTDSSRTDFGYLLRFHRFANTLFGNGALLIEACVI